MTNKTELTRRIEANPYGWSFIAKQIGMTEESLRRKVNGKGGDWYYSQIRKIQELLNLSPEELVSIFFGNETEKKVCNPR